jgi:hypothetical protein
MHHGSTPRASRGMTLMEFALAAMLVGVLSAVAVQNDARKDDLYSSGKDGESRTPLTARPSRDDIVVARDGAFVGLATDF